MMHHTGLEIKDRVSKLLFTLRSWIAGGGKTDDDFEQPKQRSAI